MGRLTSLARGTKVTMTVALNAIGSHVPPALILSRVHFKNHMLTGAPTASVGGTNPTGWPKEWLCIDYLKHFIACERPCKQYPVLDNHESHLSIPAVKVEKRMTCSCLHCHPICHVSYSCWIARSLVCTYHVIVTGCCQTHAK